MKKLIIIWSIFCLLVGLAAIAIESNAKNEVPILTNIFGLNTQVSDKDVELDPDVMHTFVVKYFSNEDNNGKEALEIKITTYVDHEFQNVYSTGLQILDPSELVLKTNIDRVNYGLFSGGGDIYKQYIYENLETKANYFNSVDGISFDATDKLENKDDLYIIDIDGKPYAFNFLKESLIDETNVMWFNTKTYLKSSFDYFLYQVFGTAKSLEKAGTYYDLTLKFDDVFKLYEYNETTGKFDKQSTKGYSQDYISFVFEKYNRGIMTNEDSLFNTITLGGEA